MIGDAVHNSTGGPGSCRFRHPHRRRGGIRKGALSDRREQALADISANVKELERLDPARAQAIADYICADDNAVLFVGLNHLDRADKHRLLIAAATVAVVRLTISDENTTEEFPDGAILLLSGGVPPAAGSRAHAHNERNLVAPVDLVFGLGETFANQPVIPVLRRLIELVAGLINSIAP